MEARSTDVGAEGKRTEAALGNILRTLDGIIETSDQQRGRITAIGSAVEVIREALFANGRCAESIVSENERLNGAIRDYLEILSRRLK